uniref:hypothetical protein n=1 Tax=Endozoicomonas sp. SESOKO1 TaxID=2828742 RepID=UPI00214877A8
VVKDFPDSPEGKLGIVRFRAECCLRGLSLNGQLVTADMVVRDFPERAEGKLGKARFKEQCCLKSLPLSGQPVTADMVIKDFPDTPEGKLGIAYFKEQCCLKNLPLSGQPVTPDMVVRDFPHSPEGKLGAAHFKEQCCLGNLLLYGQPVTPDMVVKDFPDSPEGKLGAARFKQQCCLTNLSLYGQPVTPDMVLEDFPDSPEGKLAAARFKEQCCLRNLRLNGLPVTPDAVVKGFPDSPEGRLGIARFKAECCLRGLALHGREVTPEDVVKDYQAIKARLELARFKEQCCLRGLPFNGMPVTPDAVVKDYQVANAILELARFKAECCLKGLALNGQQVTPVAVVKHFQAANAKLELARFKEQCCLRGLALHGQQVTPDELVRDYQAIRATLELVRLKEQCCLKGLVLNGQQVTPEAVVNDYQAANATLELARFKGKCCLRGLALNGQQVTPCEVIRDFPGSTEGKLGIARFKAECCLRGLPLNGQPVAPDAVIRDFPGSTEGKLGIARFKGECCLKGLLLNGQQVSPEAVVKDYECGGWLLERAFFYAQLALSARKLNSSYLDNQKVLAAFNEVPGEHALRQTKYLIQKLKKSRWYDEANEAQDILQEAWQILNNASVKDDEQRRLRCVLKFMALQNELTIDHLRVSAQQLLQSIKTLRCSFKTSRIHFFFMAHCHITGQSVNGRHIRKNQVLGCLQGFPEGSKLRHALSCWFAQCSSEANIIDELLFKRDNGVTPDSHGHGVSDNLHKASVVVSRERPGRRYRDHLPDVIPDIDSTGRRAKSVEVTVASPDRKGKFPYQARKYRNATENRFTTQAVAAETLKQWSKTDRPGFPENQAPRLNALTLRTLEIIQEINGSDSSPPILITGSYARFLQNLCTSFNDVDIICPTETSARTLLQKLQALNTDTDSEIPKNVIIWPIPGCQEINLPNAYHIELKDGDLGRKAMALQVNVDARVACGNVAPLAVHVPGVERPVRCLSFAEETGLLNDTLKHLAKNLDPLTERLKKGEVFYIPRTILFNYPQNPDERIYGLLMRYLLTLHKAWKFITLNSEVKSDHLSSQLQAEQQRLYSLTARLQTKLTDHVCRNDFGHRVNDWLSTTQPVNDYQIRRQEFIKTLLAMVHHG